MVVHYKKNSEFIEKIELEKKDLQQIPKKKKLYYIEKNKNLKINEIKKIKY